MVIMILGKALMESNSQAMVRIYLIITHHRQCTINKQQSYCDECGL